MQQPEKGEQDPRDASSEVAYSFDQNDPYDRSFPVRFVISNLHDSKRYMQSIRDLQVPSDALAVWYFGQNGFILKAGTGPLIGIDLYLTNSCASTFAHLPFRLDRQLPIFVEPDDLDVDIFITTHSHHDHADPETIRRMDRAHPIFVGPYQSTHLYRECGVPESQIRLIHPGEILSLPGAVTLQATYALPTDNTDLNHTGVLLQFSNGITFYNTGDTAFAERLHALLPSEVDICAICINGGFHNLSAKEAAAIVQAIRPRVAIPCHYDMMVNNVGSPSMLRTALDILGLKVRYQQMKYYEPWIYKRC